MIAWSGGRRLSSRKIARALRRASQVVGTPWTQRARGGAEFAASGVSKVAEFGYNPGRLDMLLYVPQAAPAPGRPLVVVLHGCGQGAADFAREAGWMDFAERLRVPLVLPQQSRENNRHGCFNWFRPSDVGRGRGEVLSIRRMVGYAIERFRSDPSQVFVVGLSAGGAMAAALLAAYPDVFAAGAVIAGLPVGCARNPVQALEQMSRPTGERTPAEWANEVRAIGPARYRGRWPRLSVWQGAEDRTVAPGNAENLAAQWTAVQGVDPEPTLITTPSPGATRTVWGPSRHPAVELWMLDELGHGFPISAERAPAREPDSGAEILLGPWGLGAFGPAFPLAAGRELRFVHATGLDATSEMGRFWGIA